VVTHSDKTDSIVNNWCASCKTTYKRVNPQLTKDCILFESDEEKLVEICFDVVGYFADPGRSKNEFLKMYQMFDPKLNSINK